MNTKLLLTLLLGLSLLSSCFQYDDVVYQGFDNVKMTKPKDGQMNIKFNLKLDNPNNYKIKIKPSDVTVFVGGKELGQIHLTETLVIDKRSEKSYPLSVDLKLKDLFKSGLGGLFEVITKQTVTLRIKGFVRGSVYGITQKRYIDQSKEMETEQYMKLLGM
jgi:LEA14-like dessication related protein